MLRESINNVRPDIFKDSFDCITESVGILTKVNVVRGICYLNFLDIQLKRTIFSFPDIHNKVQSIVFYLNFTDIILIDPHVVRNCPDLVLKMIRELYAGHMEIYFSLRLIYGEITLVLIYPLNFEARAIQAQVPRNSFN